MNEEESIAPGFSPGEKEQNDEGFSQKEQKNSRTRNKEQGTNEQMNSGTGEQGIQNR